jgi:RHS repeat-associated protein
MSKRRLRLNYKLEANWCEGKEEDLLEDENFQSKWKHDALGRIIREVHPDGSISLPKYHPEGWLRQLDVTLAGSTEKLAESFVRNISYNEKGLRTQIEYGSGVTKSNDKGVTTTYDYDEKTYRLTRLKTMDSERILQDIGYTYDPVGNITGILDASHKAVFTDRQNVEPLCEYTYDALYRLTTASGREHPALNQSTSKDGVNQNRSLNLNNGQELRNYTEHYSYDIGGNLTHIKHQTDNPWTRDMTVSDTTNRAVSTTLAHTSATVDTAFDAHGNLKKLDNLRKLCWNYRDNIASATLIERDDDAADIEYYVYDGAGQRMRKVTETLKGSDSGRRIEIAETLYLGGVEIKRVKQKEGDVLKTNSERWSLHVSDGHERIAIAHHWTLGHKKGKKQIRYQLGNHLGSASLELTDNAKIISYEEYLPYGGTAFLAGKNKTDVERKTYRYSGKERDDSTGLYYYGARYYAPWLCRWLNPDPAGTVDGLNLYAFVRGNPVTFKDPTGRMMKSTQPSRRNSTSSSNDKEKATTHQSSRKNSVSSSSRSAGHWETDVFHGDLGEGGSSSSSASADISNLQRAAPKNPRTQEMKRGVQKVSDSVKEHGTEVVKKGAKKGAKMGAKMGAVAAVPPLAVLDLAVTVYDTAKAGYRGAKKAQEKNKERKMYKSSKSHMAVDLHNENTTDSDTEAQVSQSIRINFNEVSSSDLEATTQDARRRGVRVTVAPDVIEGNNEPEYTGPILAPPPRSRFDQLKRLLKR